MDVDYINHINTCIAEYFYKLIHHTLIGQVPQNAVKPYETYKNAIRLYIDSLKDYKKFITQIVKIHELYTITTRDIMTVAIFVDTFVEHYSFQHAHKDLDGTARIAWMHKILERALNSYFEHICMLDDYAFYHKEISAELRYQLVDRLKIKIRHHGVQAQHEMYRADRENVPKKLYIQLRKEYNKLRERLDQKGIKS